MKEYKKAFFSMDSFDDTKPNIEGITYGNTWNGWACPYFTFENALLISEWVNKDQDYCKEHQLPIAQMTYDEAKDTFFYVQDLDVPSDVDEYEVSIIDGIKYYAIGSHGWCWWNMTEWNGEEESNV